MPGEKVLLTISVKTDRDNIADIIRRFLDLTRPTDALMRSNAAITCVPLDEVTQGQCVQLRKIHGLPALDGLRLAPALGPRP
jgi:hypothetical protein